MIIKSIEFKNFRQFKTGKFEFSTDPTKKFLLLLVIIHSVKQQS